MSITVSGTAQWDAWQAKIMPPVEQLRRYLWSIPVPMPRNPLRYVNIYAFAVEGGVVLIDTGWPEEESFDALKAGLAVAGYRVEDVTEIVITHTHPDHYGLAGRVQELSGAPIAMHEREAETLLAEHTVDAAEIRSMQTEHLLALGAPAGRVEESVAPVEYWTRFVGMPRADRLLTDGELVIPEHGVRAVWSPGHTNGHTCFLIEPERLLVAGDHLLPRVTPNITAWRLGEDVPLARYFESLAKVRELDIAEVLPAHEYRFIGHRDRIDELRAHHLERLDEVQDAVAADDRASTWDIASRLTWTRPFHDLQPAQWGFALGEALSHLDYLRNEGRVALEADPIQRWRAA
ncbi:MAG: MBL fold metallo-hydrolase [Aeromicrobium sp.]